VCKKKMKKKKDFGQHMYVMVAATCSADLVYWYCGWHTWENEKGILYMTNLSSSLKPHFTWVVYLWILYSVFNQEGCILICKVSCWHGTQVVFFKDAQREHDVSYHGVADSVKWNIYQSLFYYLSITYIGIFRSMSSLITSVSICSESKFCSLVGVW
jgi:hypothetical protein